MQMSIQAIKNSGKFNHITKILHNYVKMCFRIYNELYVFDMSMGTVLFDNFKATSKMYA